MIKSCSYGKVSVINLKFINFLYNRFFLYITSQTCEVNLIQCQEFKYTFLEINFELRHKNYTSFQKTAQGICLGRDSLPLSILIYFIRHSWHDCKAHRLAILLAKSIQKYNQHRLSIRIPHRTIPTTFIQQENVGKDFKF